LSRGDLKTRVERLLRGEDPDGAMAELSRLPAGKVVNVLFSFLYAGDGVLKMRAITAMGKVVSRLANQDMESARVILRRLMWNLNDESGGIGWGSAEAMGEILACHEGLAREYAPILVSYAREDGNFQENEMMQRGVLWGIGRLAQVSPTAVQDAVPHIALFLDSRDATVRGYAAWVIGMAAPGTTTDELRALLSDEEEIQIWRNQQLETCRVKDLAEAALSH
jgi:hypothetical protein